MGTRSTPSPSTSRLEEILAHTRALVAQRKAAALLADPGLVALTRSAHAHTPRGFVRSLRSTSPAVIAELKRASPSKGVLRESLDVPALSASLAAAGAAALSVLTEEKFFHGSLANLDAASRASTLPCLRKDFMLDEFQLLEARAHRADAILLLAAALDDSTLRSLAQKAIALDLDILCEVHTAAELDRVLASSSISPSTPPASPSESTPATSTASPSPSTPPSPSPPASLRQQDLSSSPKAASPPPPTSASSATPASPPSSSAKPSCAPPIPPPH